MVHEKPDPINFDFSISGNARITFVDFWDIMATYWVVSIIISCSSKKCEQDFLRYGISPSWDSKLQTKAYYGIHVSLKECILDLQFPQRSQKALDPTWGSSLTCLDRWSGRSNLYTGQGGSSLGNPSP